VVSKPSARTIVYAGQDGRYLLDGAWYFRLDDARVGEAEGWYAEKSLNGWSRIRVPHNWNGADYSENRSSVGWYRREFKVPKGTCVKPLTPQERRERRRMGAKPPKGPQTCNRFRWLATFMGANHRATVWLNGRKIGAHTGGYVPFEVPLDGLREGRNTLVVAASTLRSKNDLTHWRAASFNGYGTGGWWNFGGLSREVYVRRIDGVDIEQLEVLPRLRKLKGPARVEVIATVRWLGAERGRVGLSLGVGAGKRRIESATLKPRVFGPGAVRRIRTTITIDKPRLWQPRKGFQYKLTAAATGGDGERSVYRTRFGVRKIQKTNAGGVLLNGKRLNVRGASIHEDHALVGSAWTDSHRSEALRQLRALGSTVTRAHYPLHPAMIEKLDRAGILLWTQAPVYQLTNAHLENPAIRALAVNAVRDTVQANINHPSIFVWSVANELGSETSEAGGVGPGYANFIDTAAREVRRMDDTRLVGYDRHNRIGEPPFSPALARLDVLGLNEYFGWYKASIAGAPDSTTADLSGYLDAVHQQYPGVALFVTEYGAEASRVGPVTEKGTFDFQTQWMVDHTNIHGSKPYMNGSIVWALRDFRVHPTWGGGDPVPAPPWNNKGLIHESNAPKPAFYAVRALFRATKQFR
jgi:beta-glucuronidase